MEGLWRDVVFVLRGWRRAPGHAAGSIAILALAFGLSATAFGLVYSVFVRPLPFRDPARLVIVQDMHRTQGYGGASFANFVRWSQDSSAFEKTALLGVAMSEPGGIGGDARARVPVERVTEGFFPMLGVSPQMGRWFLAEEMSPGHDAVAILSDRAWHRWFGGGEALGRTLRLDGRVHTIVGVMPPGFHFNYGAVADIWTPMTHEAVVPPQRQHAAFGRLRPGTDITTAQEELDVLAALYEREDPALNTNWRYAVVSMSHAADWMDQPVASSILVAFAVSLGVLLIAGTNLAAVLLSRAVGRAHQVAVRRALGASRVRIVRLATVESTMLSLGGAVLGLLISLWAGGASVALLPEYLDLSPEGASGPVLAFMLLLALAAGALIGLLPALQMAHRDPATTLTRGSEGPRGRAASFMAALVAAQVAVALALLVDGGLLVQSVRQLLATPLGYRTEDVLVVRMRLPAEREENPARLLAYFDEMVRRARRLPRVTAAAAGEAIPMSGHYWGVPVVWEGQEEPRDARAVRALGHAVTPGYFETLGIPLLQGRDFDVHDSGDSHPAVIVSQALLRRGGPADDPLAARVRVDGTWRTVVGVVADVRHRGPRSEPVDHDFYLPYAQRPEASMSLVVHARGDHAGLAAELRAAARETDPGSEVRSVLAMDAFRQAQTSGTRTLATWVLTLAGLGLVLAASGLFGLVAYWVSLRVRELGIRLAVGAAPADVLRATLRQGLKPAIVGIIAGVPLAIISARFVAHSIVGVASADVASLLVALTLVSGAVGAACYVPARRASRANPADVLRS